MRIFFERYRQNGGTYIVPVEILDSILDELENEQIHQKVIIDKLSRKVQKLKRKLRRLEEW